MNRIATIILLMFAVAGLFSCGGGGATTVGDVNSDTDTDTTALTLEAPSEVIGDHSTSVVPNQVNVLTGASPAELTEQLGKYGMTGVSKTGGWVTVELPSGTDLDWAVQTLTKEYNIARAEKVTVLNTPKVIYESDTAVLESASRNSSMIPFDPMYGTDFYGVYYNGELLKRTYWGQAVAFDRMGLPGAWDVGLNTAVASQEVRVAIIDAGFFDYSTVDRSGFDEGILDADVSGLVGSDGTVTAGLDAAEWDYYDDDDNPGTRNNPYRGMGDQLLGIMADDIGDPTLQNGFSTYIWDFDGEQPYTSEDIWNEGIAGINPNATYILLKTGQLNDTTWEFTDNHLAAAIEYAAGDPAENNGGLWPNGGCGADIILLGMYASGAVGASVSTAIQTARDNNCLVIAPAGDVVDSYDNETGVLAETPVDITVDSITPASDPNCISVCSTGMNIATDLGQVIYESEYYDNIGIGWMPWMGSPFDAGPYTVAPQSNLGGDIGAIGYTLCWGTSLFYVYGSGEAGDPYTPYPGLSYTLSTARFRTNYSAAVVAGVASIVHQALHQATGTEPTDDEVWQVLNDTSQNAPLTGMSDGGLLDANSAAMQAFSGGTLYQPSMHFTGLTISQPPAELEPGVSVGFSGVVRGATFEVAPTVDSGTAPFTLTIDWDNGEEEVVVDPWVNGDPVTLDGGWDTLGQKGVNVTVTDSAGQTANWGMWINVVNPISAGITFESEQGVADPGGLINTTTYRHSANLTNVYTGLIGGTANEITLTWDFGDGTAQETGENVNHPYSAGTYTVQLLVEQTLLPDRLFTVNVTVN